MAAQWQEVDASGSEMKVGKAAAASSRCETRRSPRQQRHPLQITKLRTQIYGSKYFALVTALRCISAWACSW